MVFNDRITSQQAIGITRDIRLDMRERRFCAILFQTARKPLILKRRDVRVVEGARLESKAGKVVTWRLRSSNVRSVWRNDSARRIEIT